MPTALMRFLPALALGIPILFALWLARSQAIDAEDRFVLGFSHSLLRASERTADQMTHAVSALSALPPEAICGDAGLDLMRRLDLGSTLLQGVGYVEDDHLVCSSFANHRVISLGPPDVVTSSGDQIRLGIHLQPGDDGFVVVVVGGRWLGVVHAELPLSFVDATPGMTLVVFNKSHRVPLMLRGHLDAAWMAAPAPSGAAVLRDPARLVALVHSAHHDLSAIAAVPYDEAPDFRWRSALMFIPLGLVTGVGSALFVGHVTRSRMSLPALIQAGLRRREFHLVYQPIVDLRTGTTVAAEALLRWRRGRGEEIPPDVFIAAAEDTALMTAISQRVCRLLADDLRRTAGSDVFRDFQFGVNLSARDLQSIATVDMLRQLCADLRGVGARLVVEATERGLMDAGSAQRVIAALRHLGIRIAIDDFGTGNANLGYLTQFEVDTLKIDKLFIGALATQAVTNTVVGRIVDLADDLNLRVVAEGVETPAQAAALRALGVHLGQGWLFAPAMAIEDLAARLHDERTTGMATRPVEASYPG